MVVNRNGVWKHENGPKENSKKKMGPKPSGDDRGGPVAQERRRRKKMDGERLEGEVVMVDKDEKEKLEMGEHVLAPKRVGKTREDLEVLGFTARCPGCMSLLKGSARQAHTENRRRRIGKELRGTVKAEAAQGRVKEYSDKAAENGTKRTKSILEGQTDAPTTKAATTSSSSSSSGDATRRTMDPAGCRW